MRVYWKLLLVDVVPRGITKQACFHMNTCIQVCPLYVSIRPDPPIWDDAEYEAHRFLFYAIERGSSVWASKFTYREGDEGIIIFNFDILLLGE